MRNQVSFSMVLLTICSIIFLKNSAVAQQINGKNLQTNVAPVAGALSYINQLQPIAYEYDRASYKQLNLPAGKQVGFNGDAVRLVYPAAVTTKYYWVPAGKNNQRTVATSQVDHAQFVPLLVAAIKEQQAQIDVLKQEIKQLKAAK